MSYRRTLLVLLAILGCEGAKTVAPPSALRPTLPRVPVKVLGTGANNAETVAADGAPKQLATLAQRVAVAMEQSVLSAANGPLRPMPVGPPEAPLTLGAVKHLVSRANGGVFVTSAQGLFHNSDGRLLRSPVSDALELGAVQALDAVGTGDDEALWLLSGGVAQHWAKRALSVVELDGVPAPATIVALGPSRVLAGIDDDVLEVDVEAMTAAWLGGDLGPLGEVARGVDGTVHVIVRDGLLRVKPSGEATILELPTSVVALAAAPDGLLVGTSGAIGTLVADTLTLITQVQGLKRRGLAVDGDGVLWALTDFGLQKAAPPPVSFAARVKPMLESHCASCHHDGAAWAPTLVTYEFAAANAQLILERINSPNPSRRMPADAPKLPTEYLTLFQKWIDGGLMS